jgi:hypothetical protein
MSMTKEQIIADIQNGATIMAADVPLAATILTATGNPAAGTALQLLAPVLSSVIVSGSNMVLNFNKNLTVDQQVAALQASEFVLPGNNTPSTTNTVNQTIIDGVAAALVVHKASDQSPVDTAALLGQVATTVVATGVLPSDQSVALLYAANTVGNPDHS